MRRSKSISRNRAAWNRVPASRMGVTLHDFVKSHTFPKSRCHAPVRNASTAEFPADFREAEHFTRQRSRFAKACIGFAVCITRIREDFINIKNEIKAQIVRAGFTMQEAVDRLAEEYNWSDSVSNLSAKLQRESIRYKEVMELADVLGCDIVWVKRR